MLYATIFNEGTLLKAARVKKDKVKVPKKAKEALDLISEKTVQKHTPIISAEDSRKLLDNLKKMQERSDNIIAANMYEKASPFAMYGQAAQQAGAVSPAIEKATAEAAAATADPFAMYGQQAMQQASKGAAEPAVKQVAQYGKKLHGGFGALIGSLLGGATNEGHRTSGAIGGGIGGIYGAKLSQLPKFGTPGKIATGIVGATGLGYGGGKLGALLGRVLGGNE